MDNYYEILHSKQGDSMENIKKKYYELMRKYHPDKNKSPEAEEISKKITDAYEKICNKKNYVYEPYIPSGFRKMGYDYFPTVTQYVFNEIWKKNKLKN
tara:strand:+ start:621 stop:914 length:294 start_codon:yes stop_codon:yes gene_type:complete